MVSPLNRSPVDRIALAIRGSLDAELRSVRDSKRRAFRPQHVEGFDKIERGQVPEDPFVPYRKLFASYEFEDLREFRRQGPYLVVEALLTRANLLKYCSL